MELAPTTAETYTWLAGTQMLAVVDRLGDARVNERPSLTGANSVAAIVVHCCGVAEFWLGHVGLGRPSDRDRASEFVATASVAELHAAVDAMLDRLAADVRGLDAGGAAEATRPGREFLEGGDTSDAALVVHVIDELFQHLGQMELTADLLLHD